ARVWRVITRSPSPPELHTLSLHDALPILEGHGVVHLGVATAVVRQPGAGRHAGPRQHHGRAVAEQLERLGHHRVRRVPPEPAEGFPLPDPGRVGDVFDGGAEPAADVRDGSIGHVAQISHRADRTPPGTVGPLDLRHIAIYRDACRYGRSLA